MSSDSDGKQAFWGLLGIGLLVFFIATGIGSCCLMTGHGMKAEQAVSDE